YMLLMVGPSNAINATLYDKLNFNFVRDIAPVAPIVRFPYIMMVNPAVPAKTLPEFIAYTKANPGKISMASPGIGTTPHVNGELFKVMTGINMVHVPYRSAAAVMTDLLSGQVQLYFGTTASSLEYVRTGKLRALAVTIERRLDALPDIPAVAEFVPGYEASGWFCVGAKEHAGRDHRQAQQGDRCWRRRPQDEGAAYRPRRHRANGLTRRLRQAHRGRDREVGQGGEIVRRQAGLIDHRREVSALCGVARQHEAVELVARTAERWERPSCNQEKESIGPTPSASPTIQSPTMS